ALAQEADEAAHLTQAEVGQLEAELRAAEEKLQAAEDAAQDRVRALPLPLPLAHAAPLTPLPPARRVQALLRDAPEPEATQEEEPVPEPPRNHLSAVLQEELEAERVTRAADVEALAFTDAPASQ
ncbi:MAG: hypothetical protein ACK41Y_16440, partial [Paracoccus hibiscisoli]|uniref:hypothetical protein n=1 Tax=Paracoccus hibiscisoli TaxID=2023261 RepID=UPI00391AC1C1